MSYKSGVWVNFKKRNCTRKQSILHREPLNRDDAENAVMRCRMKIWNCKGKYAIVEIISGEIE